jgi:hypothetical protein
MKSPGGDGVRGRRHQRGQHMVEVVALVAVFTTFVWAVVRGLVVLIGEHHDEFAWAASLPL